MLAPIQALIRKAAGAIASGSRRGTVLLLVLGSLTLVLILAVVYAAVGRGDRRTAQETQVRKEAVANIDAIADHFMDIIARDVFNLVPEVTDSVALEELFSTQTPIMRREAVDLPVTDYFFTSVPGYLLGGNPLQGGQDANLVNRLRFNPDGGHNADILWDDLAGDVNDFAIFDIDPRTASDPFLATTRPVDLGASSNIDIDDLPPYLRARDWAQISNFAPDGRFVNLFYLRQDGNAEGAGFGASSLDLTRDPNGTTPRLSLFDENGVPTLNLPYEMMAGAASDGEAADWNKPMHWTMNQRWLFRPINDPAFIGTDMGDPGNENYWAYQYADADGDGFLDSRWIELVDYTNPVRPVSVLGENEMRIFVAARAIDLSSLVNVATATDSLTPPTLGHRIGAGPQDISLFKLLNMAEHGLNISGPDEIDARLGGLGYDTAFETGTGMTGDYGEFDNEVAKKIGRKSYLRLTQGAEQGSVAPYSTVPGEEDPGAVLSNDLRDYTLNLDASERLDYAASVGSVYPGVTAGGNSRTAPYSIDDLVELLTFHGINDDRNFSTLERALSAVNDGSDIPISSFSLARSDNPTASDAWPPTGRADALDLKYLRSAVDIRRMLTTVSGSRPLRSSILEQADFAALSENADRKILLDNIVLSDGTYPTTNAAPDFEFNTQQSELIANTFKVYLDLLAPDLRQEDWEGNTATGMTPEFTQRMTQYYGYMGPELAVRLAGHMALNFRDMADAPYVIDPLTGLPDASLMPAGADRFNILNLNLSDPTDLAAYNRRVDEPSVAALRLALDWQPDIATGLLKQLWDAGLKLDIDEVRGVDPGELVAYDGVNTSHHAMILYGVEPQPFLSQVSSMTMYTDFNYSFEDNETGTSPDPEWKPSDINGGNGPDGIPDNDDDFDGLPNIRGVVDTTNDDFLFQVLFVQMFNPFDVPILLDRYYIEFADSFYSFTDGSGATPVVLQPRSTIVLWASNPGEPEEIDLRLSNAGVTHRNLPGTTAFETMIRRQIEIGTDVPLVQMNKRYAKVTAGTTYDLVPATDVRDIFHEDASTRSVANRAVMLWRDALSYDTSGGSGLIDWTLSTLDLASRSTDQLVDRLRDTSGFAVESRSLVGGPARAALDRRLELQPVFGPNREYQVNNAIRGDDANRAGPDILPGVGGTNYNFEMQLAVALWGNISRKDDSTFNSGTSAVDYYNGNVPVGTVGQGDGPVEGTPVGALPAKVFEPNAHTPAGSYRPYDPSLYLSHEIHVAGDDQFDDGILPKELSLVAHFSPSGATPFPDVTSTSLAELWQSLLSGAQRPLIFAELSTPVFGRDGVTPIALSASIEPSQVTDFGAYEGDRYIKVTVNQTEFRDLVSGRRTLRVGDMLLPLAVGAYRTPLEVGPSSEPATPDGLYSDDVLVRLAQYEAQWTTLGESLAAAAGYSDSVGPGGGVSSLGPKDPFRSLSFDFPTPTSPVGTPKQEKYVLDRGQLRLDAFVPFINIDVTTGSAGPLTEGSGDFDPEVNIRRGLGIPMALNIFEMAQAGTDMGLLAMGGLDRPVMGTINTNTAEPEVLRLHPALAMDMFAAAGATIPDRLWWPRTLMQLPLNETPYRLNLFEDKTLSGTPASFADVGSFIAAYRDPARYALLNLGSPLGGGGASVEVDVFERTLVDDANPALGVRVNRLPDPIDPVAIPRSGIDGLRSGQGFLSIGELFAARDMEADQTQHHMGGFARDDRTIGLGFVDQRDPDDANYLRGIEFYQTIDAAKINELRAGQIQIATFGNHPTGDLIGLGLNYGGTITPPSTVPGSGPTSGDAYPGFPDGAALPIMPDQIPDSYDEQLVQLNAVLNSMTVRSDYYAVWFVVHGYKESDTVGLTDTDPLTPSFAARYLMILDRSNVTQKGDRPKVLARVQLPMLPAPPTGMN